MKAIFDNNKDIYDFCLVSLWSNKVSVNPLYHFVRQSINCITSKIIQQRLHEFDSRIEVLEDEKNVLRYQNKYPCAPALLVLAAVLEKKYKVRIISLDVEREKLGREDWLDEISKDISYKTKYGVLVSFVTTELVQLHQFSRKIKDYNSHLSFIVGGIHATYNDVELLNDKNIDYVMRGEGEITTLELCNAIVDRSDMENILGITYRTGGGIKTNPERPFMDLSDSPIPAYHYIESFMDRVILTTMFSRGCPYGCDYCAESAFWSSNVRYKDTKKFVDELDLLCNRYNQHFIHIADSTFGTNKSKLIELCDELEQRNLGAFFSINIRPDIFEYMGEELVVRLKNLNFVEFNMGIETADSEIINALNRKQNNSNILSTLKKLKKIGIPFVKVYLMIGSPNDDRISFEKTVKLIEQLLEDELIFYATCKYFVPSVGSKLYESLNTNLYNLNATTRLERYNSPPIFIPNDSIAEEMDVYLQLIQVVQYKHLLKKCTIEEQERMKQSLDDFVIKNYYKAFYY